VNATNALGDTALIIASRAGEADVVRLLLGAGAATGLRDRDRFTAAEAAEARSFRAIAAMLRGS
jgi:ankyrin repeat protein